MAANEMVTAGVRNALEQFFQAYERGDVDAAVKLLLPSADLVMIGTAADEWSEGPDAARAQFERDIGQSDSRSITLGRLLVSALGDVAWAAAEATVGVTAGGRSLALPVRLTAVLERRGDGWLLAQAHISTPDDSTPQGSSYPSRLT